MITQTAFVGFRVGVLVLILVGIPVGLSLEFAVTSQSQLEWALGSVNPGDVIRIGNVDILVNRPITTVTNGTEGAPIVITGLGDNSILSRDQSHTTLHIRNSHYIIENMKLTMSGEFYGMEVHKWVTEVIIRNVTMENPRNEVSYRGIEHRGESLVVDNCTFRVPSIAIACVDNALSHCVVSNSRFVLSNDLTFGEAIYVNMGTLIAENNEFSTMKEGDKWGYFIDMEYCNATVRNNVGVGGRHAGFMIRGNDGWNSYYNFHGNHCNLYSNVWCIDVRSAQLYNKTFVDTDNTFENALGLTNKPPGMKSSA